MPRSPRIEGIRSCLAHEPAPIGEPRKLVPRRGDSTSPRRPKHSAGNPTRLVPSSSCLARAARFARQSSSLRSPEQLASLARAARASPKTTEYPAYGSRKFARKSTPSEQLAALAEPTPSKPRLVRGPTAWGWRQDEVQTLKRYPRTSGVGIPGKVYAVPRSSACTAQTKPPGTPTPPDVEGS